MDAAQIRFCTSADGTRIAYATYGEPGLHPVLNVHSWPLAQGFGDSPEERAYYDELASDRQAVRFDRRGIGASQREINDVSLDGQIADLAAVVDDAGFETFDMAGFADGAAVAAGYAARHPERVSRLVLSGAYSRGEEIARPEQTHSIVTLIRENWPLARRALAGLFTTAGSIEAQRSFSSMLRQVVSAEAAAQYIEYQNNLDVRKELAKLHTPTLVLNHRAAAMDWGAATVSVAALIPGAHLVAFEDQGFLALARILRKFFDETPASERAATLPQGTAIILFADIADSTALTERLGDAAFREKARSLDEALRRAIASNGGTAIEGKLLGDGVLATFGAAREAIACAIALHRLAAEAGGGPDPEHVLSEAKEPLTHDPLLLHVGIHAGDVIRESNNVYGGAVNIASRVAGEAAAGETLVSATVRDLARTSAGVSFEDRGERELKGVGEPVRVFGVKEA